MEPRGLQERRRLSLRAIGSDARPRSPSVNAGCSVKRSRVSSPLCESSTAASDDDRDTPLTVMAYAKMMRRPGVMSREAALADPTRRSVVDRLGRGSASVSELAGAFDMVCPHSSNTRFLESSA